MHDCRKTKKKLVDLVFGEFNAAQQARALAEVGSCPACAEEYQSMLATLRAFDQVADVMMPEESYWTGYEARLRAKLAAPVAPNRRERMAGWLAGLLAKPALPLAVAGLILLIAASVVWFSRQRNGNPQELVVKTTPTPQPTPTVELPVPSGAPQVEIQTEQWVAVKVNPRQQRRMRAVAQPKESLPDDLIATNQPPERTRIIPPAAPDSHFEKAQLLLRSFRNARLEEKGAAFNVAYEKRQAGKLVYDNILLRRQAEAKGHWPVEEVLNNLEPLLLDIANLPDKPSRDEVRVIKERIQKQEMIATLQIASSGAERFSAPALLGR